MAKPSGPSVSLAQLARIGFVGLAATLFALVFVPPGAERSSEAAPKRAAKKKLGDACPKGNSQCRSRHCDSGSGSGGTDRCVPAPGTGKNGQYCSKDGHCSDSMGLACVTYNDELERRECGPASPVGKGCTYNTSCASGICGPWDPGTRACVPKANTAKAGELCSDNKHCINGNCIGHHCIAQAGVGQECHDNSNCASGTCHAFFSVETKDRCVPAAGQGKKGQFCTNNGHCKNNSCVGLRCKKAPSKVSVGGWCSANQNCKSGSCDVPNAPEQKCIPAAGTGSSGQYCTNNGHCMSGSCLDKRCKQVASRSLSIGDLCSKNSECKSNACMGNSALDPKCVPAIGRGSSGQHCMHNNQCKKGLTCKGYTCDTKSPTGGWCDHSDNADCKSNRCGSWTASTYACIPQDGTAKVGQKCSAHAHCQNKNCINHACRKPVSLGQSCETDHSCNSGYCDRGSGSGGTNKCVPAVGTGTTNKYCSKDRHCKSNDCSNNKCVSMKGLGSSCPGGNSQCKSGYCDAGSGSGNTNKCVPQAGKGKTGEYCSQNAHCKSKTCKSNKCSSKKALGGSCPGGDSQCYSGYCDSGMGSGGTDKCVPKSGTGKKGDYCSQNGHCKPGKSCNSHKCS